MVAGPGGTFASDGCPVAVGQWLWRLVFRARLEAVAMTASCEPGSVCCVCTQGAAVGEIDAVAGRRDRGVRDSRLHREGVMAATRITQTLEFGVARSAAA
jgi:hypothetical protein